MSKFTSPPRVGEQRSIMTTSLASAPSPVGLDAYNRDGIGKERGLGEMESHLKPKMLNLWPQSPNGPGGGSQGGQTPRESDMRLNQHICDMVKLHVDIHIKAFVERLDRIEGLLAARRDVFGGATTPQRYSPRLLQPPSPRRLHDEDAASTHSSSPFQFPQRVPLRHAAMAAFATSVPSSQVPRLLPQHQSPSLISDSNQVEQETQSSYSHEPPRDAVIENTDAVRSNSNRWTSKQRSPVGGQAAGAASDEAEQDRHTKSIMKHASQTALRQLHAGLQADNEQHNGTALGKKLHALEADSSSVAAVRTGNGTHARCGTGCVSNEAIDAQAHNRKDTWCISREASVVSFQAENEQDHEVLHDLEIRTPVAGNTSDGVLFCSPGVAKGLVVATLLEQHLMGGSAEVEEAARVSKQLFQSSSRFNERDVADATPLEQNLTRDGGEVQPEETRATKQSFRNKGSGASSGDITIVDANVQDLSSRPDNDRTTPITAAGADHVARPFVPRQRSNDFKSDSPVDNHNFMSELKQRIQRHASRDTFPDRPKKSQSPMKNVSGDVDEKSPRATRSLESQSDQSFSVTDLQDAKFCKRNGVDLQAREQWLSDSDFMAAFGMNREDFAALQKWKRDEKKKACGIF